MQISKRLLRSEFAFEEIISIGIGINPIDGMHDAVDLARRQEFIDLGQRRSQIVHFGFEPRRQTTCYDEFLTSTAFIIGIRQYFVDRFFDRFLLKCTRIDDYGIGALWIWRQRPARLAQLTEHDLGIDARLRAS